MYVDCDRCTVRGPACDGCVVSVLLGPPEPVEWDDTESAALATLAEYGLVPPLRMETAPGLRGCDVNHMHLSA